MAGKEELIASKVLELVGGAKNVISATNCMTRLRLLVNDEKKVNVDEIKKILGVLSVLTDGATIQVVLGPGKARKVTEEFNKLIKLSESDIPNAILDEEARKQKEIDEAKLSGNGFIRFWQKFGLFFKHIKWKKGFRHIGNIFSPLVPGFIMFGVLFSISCLIQIIGSGGKPEAGVAPLSNTAKAFYYIFYCLSKGFIAYLSVLVGVNAAKEFSVTPVIGGAIGGLAIFPEILEISKLIPGWSWEVIIDKNPAIRGIIMAGNGGVLAVILAVFLIGFLERWIKKWMPDVLDNIFTPILTILIGGVVFLFAIMPVMGFIMNGLTSGINSLASSNTHVVVRIIVGFFLGALFLPTVMLGLHRGFDSIYSDFMSRGMPVPIYPVFAMADAAQAGVGFAIYLKARKYKHERLQQNALGGVIPQVLGVSEPLIYGVTLPMVKPFITVGIGAGIGGAFIMAMGLQSTAYAASGLMAIPMMIYLNGKANPVGGILTYISGWAISVVAGFIATWFLITEKDLNKVERI